MSFVLLPAAEGLWACWKLNKKHITGSLFLGLVSWPFLQQLLQLLSHGDWSQKEREQQSHPTHTLCLVGPQWKHSFMLPALVRGQVQVWQVCQAFLCLGRQSTGGQRRTPPLSSAAHIETRVVCIPPREDGVQPNRQVPGCTSPEAALNLHSGLKAPEPLSSGLLPSPFAV